MHAEESNAKAAATPVRTDGVGATQMPAMVQFGAAARGQSAELSGGAVHEIAAGGFGGAPGALPHLGAIQSAFGHHDVSQVQAYVGGSAAQASAALGAQAYAAGDSVAFAQSPSLHLAAHEAAHVVQQRGGVSLKGGVGAPGDAHEQHADAVADAVVRGQSAEGLLDRYTGASEAGVQMACECNDCPICEARKNKGGTQGVQFNLIEDAMNAGAELVDDARNFIDLLGPKQALLDKIRQVDWIINAVDSTKNTHQANPEHHAKMVLELAGVGVSVALEQGAFAERIAGCEDLDSVKKLSKDFDTWRAGRVTSLGEELEAKVEEYRAIERGWLQTFANTAVCEDPVDLNRSGQGANLCLSGDKSQATVTVETRVNCTFGRTTTAQADSDGDGTPDVADWTTAEKTAFMTKFQSQLDHVWTTGAGQNAPFRCVAPQDYLLADESEKWSAITGVMKAQVTADATNPHFNLDVDKKTAAESPRAHVSQAGGHFYLDDADAGYHTSGPDAGNPDGTQMTLAHEWHHMIGNPDEYAENSASQSGSSSTPAVHANNWGTCQTHFNNIINDTTKPQTERDQATADLAALNNHATDMDTAAGFQSGIFPLAGRSDIPDECFAIRGMWDASDPGHRRLRPGAQSQRGGTNISASAADAARLSDRGMQVRPYMREGIVEALKSMLEGVFTPEVAFDHNFQDMSIEDATDVIQVRIQNVVSDFATDLGSSRAPGDEVPDTHEHDH